MKGLAAASFQIVNCTERRLCCSLNVISQPDKWDFGNMAGMTFSINTLPHTDVKALLILPHSLSPSLSRCGNWWTHTEALTVLLAVFFYNNPKCASSLFLAFIHTHKAHTGLHCSIYEVPGNYVKSKIHPLYTAGLICLLLPLLHIAIHDKHWAMCSQQNPYANPSIHSWK